MNTLYLSGGTFVQAHKREQPLQERYASRTSRDILQVRYLQREAVLCLQSSHSDSRDNMALRKNIDDQEGENRDNRSSHHQRPLRGVLSAELAEHQRYGKVRWGVEHDQWPEKVVPLADEGENAQCCKWCSEQWQHDFPENCPAIRTIYNCRLLQFKRKTHDKLPHEEDTEGTEERGWQNQREQRIQQAKLFHGEEDGNDGELEGNHQRCQERKEDDLPSRKLNTSEGITSHRARDQLTDRHSNRDNGTIHVREIEGQGIERLRVVPPLKWVRNE